MSLNLVEIAAKTVIVIKCIVIKMSILKDICPSDGTLNGAMSSITTRLASKNLFYLISIKCRLVRAARETLNFQK